MRSAQIVSHGDLDGLASAAIILRKNPDSKLSFSLPSELAETLSKLKPSELIFIVDVALDGAVKERVLAELGRLRGAGSEIVFIDHHPSSLRARSELARYCEIVIDTSKAASQLTSLYLDPSSIDLADLGAIGDRLIEDESHPLFARAGKIRKALLFDPDDAIFRERVARLLALRTYEDPEIERRAKAYLRRRKEVLASAEQRIIFEDAAKLIVDATSIDIRGLAGTVAGKLSTKRGKACFVLFVDPRAPKTLIVTARARGLDLDALLGGICSALGGSGGGHPTAASGRVPLEKRYELIERLRRL